MTPLARKLALISICLLLSSCATPIKRQVRFIPVYKERILLSGKIRFIDSSSAVNYATFEMKRPPKAQVLRMRDGSIKVTWVTTKRRSEKLMYIDSGLHPVEIPAKIIQETKDLDAEIPTDRPYVLRGFGESTAFVGDFITLGGPVKARQARDSNMLELNR